MDTDYDRALDELGKTRSELARYKRQNAEQQRRIRELERALSDALMYAPSAEAKKYLALVEKGE